MAVEYSAQAQKVISQLKEFDKEDFEKWFIKEAYTAGSKHIWAYMLTRKDNPKGR